MNYVPILVGLGACFWAICSWIQEEACVKSKGLLLDCEMKAAEGFRITLSSSEVHLTSGKNGTFEMPCSQKPLEDLGVEGFSGLVVLGPPFDANWTIGHCGSSSAWEQVAFCPSRTMVGHEVQANFLDTFYEALVVCPDGAYVAPFLVFHKDGKFRICDESLCAKQTCLRLTSLPSLNNLDECLWKNVEKNFPNVIEAASQDAGLLDVLQGSCARLVSKATDLDPKVEQNLQKLAAQYDPWQRSGAGKHILVDTSGSMTNIMDRVFWKKLGAEFHNVPISKASDSQFSRRGHMGQMLLKLLGSLAGYSMLIVVSDFQDGVEESFCAEIGHQAVAKHAVVVLESVERYPQHCLHEVAKRSGGHSSVGRIARK